MHVKEPRTLIVEELGVYPGVSGSHSKRPCLQVSSGFWATVLKCAFVGSNPGMAGHGACVLEQDTLLTTIASSLGWDVKP